MVRNRSLRLVVHLGAKRADYALMHRTSDGREHTDRRMSWGTLPLPATEDQPADVLALLQRVVYDLCRRHGADPAAGGSGAPGGGGGRTIAPAVDTLPLFLISDDGQTLDYDGKPV